MIDVLVNGGHFLSVSVPVQTSPDVAGPSAQEAADDPGGETASDGADDAFESEGDLAPSATQSGGRVGSAGVYTLPDGTKVALANVEHYAYRDPLLYAFNYDEFVMVFKLEKVNPEECNEPHPGKRAPPLACVPLPSTTSFA
jgi:hypothetical protein